MNKLTFLCFLVFLVLPFRSAEQEYCPRSYQISSKHEDSELQDESDDGEFEFEGLSFWESDRSNNVLVNVDGFGAVGDGVADDTQAFVDAWEQACSTPKSVFLVPQGRRYLVNATRFKGPCTDKLIIQIDGAIVAPDDPETWDPKSPRSWLSFYKLNKAYIQGEGVIDGSGSKWWAASCKRNKTNPCKGAPTVRFNSLLIISMSPQCFIWNIQNGQQMNFIIGRCESVSVIGVKVSAPEDSPNTDGIHITGSKNIVLQNCKIGTGDDCVSIVNASSNIKMKNIFCGPGHGISIGSLGKSNSIGIVEKVELDTAFIQDTTNGIRIKTWQGGSGHVRAIHYQNVKMENVSNPIIIDQFYCDSPKTCQNQTSAIEIRDIMYANITGTSRSRVAMKFECSDTVPCTNIVLNNINLQRKDETVETVCNNALGYNIGYVHPSAECLSSSDKDTMFLQEKAVTKSSREYLIRTEL